MAKKKKWLCDWRMENGIGIFGRAQDTGEMLKEESAEHRTGMRMGNV